MSKRRSEDFYNLPFQQPTEHNAVMENGLEPTDLELLQIVAEEKAAADHRQRLMAQAEKNDRRALDTATADLSSAYQNDKLDSYGTAA
jgi:hypothetical protein